MATPLGVPLLRSSNFDCSQVCVPSACKTLVASRKTENVSQSLRGNSKVVPRLCPRLCLKKQGITESAQRRNCLAEQTSCFTPNAHLRGGQPYLTVIVSTCAPETA